MLARIMTLVTRQNLIAVQHASAWFNRPRSTHCTRVPSSMSLIFDQVPPKVIRMSMVAAFQLAEDARGLCCWLLHFRDLYQSANVQIRCTRPFVEARNAWELSAWLLVRTLKIHVSKHCSDWNRSEKCWWYRWSHHVRSKQSEKA